MADPYHYKMCGLDNIYLKGEGVIIGAGKYGATVSIANMEQLHALIATDIATSTLALKGKELRFLRVQLDLSQVQFASLIESTKQNIGRYERDEIEGGIPGSVQMAARMLYLAYTKHPDIAKVVADLAELDRCATGDRFFCGNDQNHWEEAQEHSICA